MTNKTNYILLAAISLASLLPVHANDGSALTTAVPEMATGVSTVATPADATIEKAVQILKEMNSGHVNKSSGSSFNKQFKTDKILILGGSAVFPM
jgi:hypothetical protein